MTGRTRGSPLNFLNKRLMARMSAAAPGIRRGSEEEEKQMKVNERRKRSGKTKNEEERDGRDGWEREEDGGEEEKDG